MSSQRIVRLHRDRAKGVIHVFGDESYLLTVPGGFHDARLRLRAVVDGDDLEELRALARTWERGKADRAIARRTAREEAPIAPSVATGRHRDRRGRAWLLLEPGPSLRASQDDLDRYPPGTELDVEQVAALRTSDATLRAGDLVGALCAARPRTETEIRDRLGRRGVETSPALDAAIERYRRAGLVVDDTAFVRWYLERRGIARGKGVRALLPQLRPLVADPAIIDAIAAESDQDEAFANAVERARRGLDLGDDQDRRRLSARLASRGFAYDRIRPLLETLARDDEDDDDEDVEPTEAERAADDATFEAAAAKARRGLDLADERSRRKFVDRLRRKGYGFERIRPLLAAADDTGD